MLSDSALKSMNVLFTTPCYVSNVTMNYVVSCFDLIRESMRRGLNFNTHLHSESLVTRARNEIVKFFLANEEYTHLFFINSDVAFRPEAAFRLLLANRDVASGIYPIKRFNWPAEGWWVTIGNNTFRMLLRRSEDFAAPGRRPNSEPLTLATAHMTSTVSFWMAAATYVCSLPPPLPRLRLELCRARKSTQVSSSRTFTTLRERQGGNPWRCRDFPQG